MRLYAFQCGGDFSDKSIQDPLDETSAPRSISRGPHICSIIHKGPCSSTVACLPRS